MATGRFRWRTRVRRHLPWFLIDRGFAERPDRDCGDHEYFNHDSIVEHCVHCTVGERPYDPRHFLVDVEPDRAGRRSRSYVEIGPPLDTPEVDPRADDELRARLRHLFEALADDLGQAAILHVGPLGGDWLLLLLEARNERGAGISVIDFGRHGLLLEVAEGGRWELDRTPADIDFVDDVVRSVIAGRVSEARAPGRSAVRVELAGGKVERTSVVVAPTGCLPIPGWARRTRHVDFEPYE